ncbi:MAG: hypothetical protein U5O16_02885 [Rhodococcus sp. (in: high G+C Gram-positive bacteria)]|uniref:hypothetical protein n=1 Tax=Rhodococcus sp. TaxID=1831 RepID=UPI002AD60C2A|nr:hypothetical protein [Rhodococcus sp. (in: high G+C Gram-positive bacteria)]
MIDPLRDPANSWDDDRDDDRGALVDRAYDAHVAQQLEQPAVEFPTVPHFIQWGCGTCGKWRSAPCAPSCVFGGQADPAEFKVARIEAERRKALDAAMNGEQE